MSILYMHGRVSCSRTEVVYNIMANAFTAEAKFYAPGRPPWSDGLTLCGRTKRSWSRAVAPKQREATGKVVEKDAMNLWLLLRRQKEDAVWVVNNLKVRRSFKKWSMQQLTLQRLNCLRYLCKFRLSCLHNQIGTNSIGCEI
jgi:hypothetical protein